MSPLMFPETRPTLLETLATTGAKPKASSVGKVISEPDPTTALTAPAATPAPRIASASAGPTYASHLLDRKRGPETPQRSVSRSTSVGRPVASAAATQGSPGQRSGTARADQRAALR